MKLTTQSEKPLKSIDERDSLYTLKADCRFYYHHNKSLILNMFKILVVAIVLIVVVGFIVLTYKNSPFPKAEPNPEEDVPPHEKVEQKRKPSRESGVSATLKHGKEKYG